MSQVVAPPPEQEERLGAARPPRRHRPRRHSVLRDILEVLFLAGALYVIITLALQTVRVDGTSMLPTLSDGDLLFADKVTYHFRAPSRGDIIILLPPDDPSKDFIKRVIGVPGDQVRIVPDHVGADGRAHAAVEVRPGGQDPVQIVEEPYLPDQSKDPWSQQTACCGPDGRASSTPQWFTIAQDQFFVMGDNRNASKDSRTIGLIPRGNIQGRAWVRIWPLSHLGFMGSGPTLAAAAALPLPVVRLGWRRRRRRRGADPAARAPRPRRARPPVVRG